MKPAIWHGKREMRVVQGLDAKSQESTDVSVRMASSGLCGSGLHLEATLPACADFQVKADGNIKTVFRP